MTSMSYVTCSWCHRVCAVKDTRCPTCGHNPAVARAHCDCRVCHPHTGSPPRGTTWGEADPVPGPLLDLGQGGLLGHDFSPQSDFNPPAPSPGPNYGGGGGFSGGGAGGEL